MVDSRSVTGGHVALLPGMSAELEVTGYFARLDAYPVYNEKTGLTVNKTLTNGFYIEDEDAGSITAINSRAAVTYLHKKARENTIWFIARTEVNGQPEKGMFRVIYVPVHDHASIVTGGPAYGTYQSEGDRQVTPTEEGA